MGIPLEMALYDVVSSSRKKKLASIPQVCARLNQKPPVKRPPERMSSLMRSSPNRTVVPGRPMTPASASGVPGGLVVKSGGKWSPLVHQSRYSALIQAHPVGKPQYPHSSRQLITTHEASAAWHVWSATATGAPRRALVHAIANGDSDVSAAKLSGGPTAARVADSANKVLVLWPS